ncbi:MAG: GTP-binding protein, partial [Clostridia bacterium]|nr:GTP-binding protein [Clostridia bacterium]MBQ7604041.1 GTP-binding protein [Clostridia bacterium]
MKTIKTDIISGFLGAGKTTLIKKLLAEVFSKRGEKVVVIENEFGKVGIDGAFLGDAGVNVTEMNSGCICCSLVGDFAEALKKVCSDFEPDRIIIEPSGVGKLSDVATAVLGAGVEGLTVNCMTAVVDAKKCRMYLRNFEEFYKNQIESATAVILSRTGKMDRASIEQAVSVVRELNPGATVVTTDWDDLDGQAMLSAMENTETAEAELKKLLDEMEKEEHEHHHH